MSKQLTNKESFSLGPSALLSFFVLDGTSIGFNEVFYFHDGANSYYQPIVFNGQSYTPFPIKVTDMGYDGQGGIVRPKLYASNVGGFLSKILLQNQDLVGAKVTRRRVFARFIDAVNFPPLFVNPFGTPDPTAAYPDEIFYVNRKVREAHDEIQWELSSLFELDGVKLPNRTMFGLICAFTYRDKSCGKTGFPVADRNNKLFVGGVGTYGFPGLNDKGIYNPSVTYNPRDFVQIFSTLSNLTDISLVYVCVNTTVGVSPFANSVNWVRGDCSKSMAGCRINFDAPAPLPFGGFPGIVRSPAILSS